MKKGFKLLGFVAVTFLLFVAVAVVAFYHLIQVGELRRFLVSEIERKTDLKIQLGEADLELGWITGISFRDVALSVPESSQRVITAERVTARVALLPLLERKVVFYEIRFAKPIARMERDRNGNILLLDQLLNLPFLTEKAGTISVDLRAVGVENGEIDFHDQLAEGGSATTHLRAIDLELDRIRGQALRDFLRSLVKVGRQRPQGAALDFSLQSDIERDGKRTMLRAKGRMIFPDQKLGFANAWWDATVQLPGAPAAIVQRYLGSRMPIKSLSGSLTPRLHIEGNAAERVHVKGEVAFTGLAIEAPDFFGAALTPGDGMLNLDLEWSSGRLEIAQMALRSNELWLNARGDAQAGPNGETQIRLDLTAPALPIAIFRKYLPLRLPGMAQWGMYAAAIEEGEIQVERAGLNASLSSLGRIAQTGLDERVRIDAVLRNVRLKLNNQHYLPIRRVQGRVSLQNGVLAFKDMKAEYGQSRFSEIDGSYRLGAPDRGSVELQARGELDLAELGEQLKSGVLGSRTAKLASSVSEMGGKGKIDLA
ncbi:MAG: AsmA family protein, partial [Candidatus Binatia bacterium]